MDIREIVKHESVNNITNLANICKVSKQCARKWRRLPPGRCKFVHDVTKIDYEVLRPDISWQKDAYNTIIGWFTPFSGGSFDSYTHNNKVESANKKPEPTSKLIQPFQTPK